MDHLTTAERDLMPNWYDKSNLPSIIALADADGAHGPVTREAFLAIVDDVLAEADAYKARVQHALADLLLQYCPELKHEDAPVAPADALTRYGAFFTCTPGCIEDDTSCMTYPELHEHWRTFHQDEPFMDFEDFSFKQPWLASHGQYVLPSVAREVLIAVGIPLETTYVELDGWVREGRLFCACGDPSLPPPEDMDWQQLVRSLTRFGLIYMSLTYA